MCIVVKPKQLREFFICLIQWFSIFKWPLTQNSTFRGLPYLQTSCKMYILNTIWIHPAHIFFTKSQFYLQYFLLAYWQGKP